MRYWHEMNDKFAFGDGGSVPPDAWVCREAYVRVINGLAKIRGSAQRVVAFERGGCHNPCLILMVPADAIKKAKGHGDGFPVVESIDDLGLTEVIKPDWIMEDIIMELLDSGSPDGAVVVRPKLDKTFIRKILKAERVKARKAGKKHKNH